MARRLTQWGIFNDTRTLAGTSSANINVGAAFLAEQGIATLRGHTVTRTLGEVAIRPTPASTGMQTFAMGLLVVGGGATPVSNPNDDNADYFWYYAGSVGQDGSETSIGFFGGTTRYIHIDSRAQRKIAAMEASVWLQIRNVTTGSFLINTRGRILYKLP